MPQRSKVLVWTCLLLALVLLFSTLGLARPEERRKVALVVGVNKYRHSDLNKPNSLQFPENDATELAAELKKGGYEVIVLTGKEATLEAIRAQLDSLRKKPGDGGIFLVALAGHGMQPEGSEEAYYCPHDADQRVRKVGEKDPWDYKTLLPLSEVVGNLKASTASSRMLLVDACRNDPASGRGRGVGTNLKTGELPDNTAVLLSCSRGQRAYEDKTWGTGHGAFFHQVLEGMRGKGEDRKGRITADSLWSHVAETVPEEVEKVFGSDFKQRPHRVISGEVDLLLQKVAGRDRITNKAGMEFVYIKPGTFLMGSPEEEHEHQKNETQHRVTLKKGYYLQTTLVTQKQWKAVMGDDNNPSKFKGDDLPVDNVSWDMAKEFCAKLNTKEGKNYYRLPTEAEWEYAARAGTTTPFWQGETITTDQVNFNGDYPYREKDPKGEYRKTTTPVKKFTANPWGLHDMGGNLWQWCEDIYAEYPKEDIEDTQSPQKGDKDTSRVLRGGSWDDDARLCRAAYRYWSAPAHRNDFFGFRVAFRLD